MTAFASAILAALPGAGVQPEKAGTGATGGDAALGVFEAMLAGLTDAITAGGVEDGKALAGPDIDVAQPDAAVVDPTLAGASNVLPFAPLATGLAATQAEAAATPEPVEGSATPAVTGTATVVDLAADTALSVDGDPPAASTPATVMSAPLETVEAAATAPRASTPEAAQAAASPTVETAPAAKADDQTPVEVVTASDTAASQPAAEPPADADLPPPPTADASRAAAAAPAASTAAAAMAAASAAPARPVETPKTQPAVAKTDAAPAAATTTTTAAASTAPQAAPATDTVAAAASAMAATAEAQVEAAPAVAAVVTPPRPSTSASETRRTASAAVANAAAKGDQAATAVSSDLDGLDGAEPRPSDEVVVQADAGAEAAPDIAPVPVEVVETDEPDRQAPAADVRAAATQAAAQAAEPAAASRMSAETVAKLSADIVRKLEGQSTKFDLQLDPHGLGKVDVSVEIDRDGRLTAALSFDSAQAATDLKSRSGELRAALEQAGFEVSDSGLSFDMASQGGGFGGREAGEQSRTWSGRAFLAAQNGLDEADARAVLSSNSRAASGGVDIRI